MTAEHSPTTPGNWRDIVGHYETCFRKHGVSPAGVDWPNGDDLAARFDVMLEILEGAGDRPVLLDLGCGPGLLLDYLKQRQPAKPVVYQGIDLSVPMIETARTRWPGMDFAVRDIVADPLAPQSVDVVIMNGVMTERVNLEHDQMVALAKSLIAAAFRAARVGVVFNVMNKHVDWERRELFYWPFDDAAAFLKAEVSRHYSFRADYGLYEYTCTVRRQPRRRAGGDAQTWWER